MNATRPRRRLFKKDRKRELCHDVVSFPFACNHYTARTTGYGLRSGEKPMLARGNSLFALLLSSLFSPFVLYAYRSITQWQAERSYNNFFWESQRQHRIFCVYCMQFPSNFIIIQYVVLQSVICSCNSYLFLGKKKKVVARYYLISFCFLAFGFVA